MPKITQPTPSPASASTAASPGTAGISNPRSLKSSSGARRTRASDRKRTSKKSIITEDTPIDGKSVGEWNRSWVHLPGGLFNLPPELRDRVGLYRVRLAGDVRFIGCAREPGNGGIAKRLRDFTRNAAGGRDHHAGALIHQHRHEVEIDLLVTGTDEAAGHAAQRLKSALLQVFRPPWNVRASKTKGR